MLKKLGRKFYHNQSKEIKFLVKKKKNHGHLYYIRIIKIIGNQNYF